VLEHAVTPAATARFPFAAKTMAPAAMTAVALFALRVPMTV
jgi:hypothetical protein